MTIEIHDLNISGDWHEVATEARERVWGVLVGVANRDEAIDPADPSFFRLAATLYRALWDESTFFVVVWKGKRIMAAWDRPTAEYLAPAWRVDSRLYVVELRKVDDAWQLAINEDTTWRELEDDDG